MRIAAGRCSASREAVPLPMAMASLESIRPASIFVSPKSASPPKFNSRPPPSDTGDDGGGAAHGLVAHPDGLAGLDIRQAVVVDDLQNLRLIQAGNGLGPLVVVHQHHALAPGTQQVIPGQGAHDFFVLVQHRVAAVAAFQHHLADVVDIVRQVDGLENKIDSYPSSLSGGQKQRVSIARALANKPEILLCDEATSALDLETTEGILALLQRINRELGITIVFITHQLDVAKQIFDRVAVMENGVVVEQGNTFDVFSAPKHPTTKALVERYLGIAVPPQLVPSLPAGTIVELRYKGDAALEPLISQVAQDYGVSIDVLHANVEYFGSQAIGILIVLVSGAGEPLLQALNTLRTHVFSYRELDRGQLVVAAEAADNQEA